MNKGIDTAIKALEEYYIEHGRTRPIEYAYGFFDAMAILRGMSQMHLSDISDSAESMMKTTISREKEAQDGTTRII